MGTRGNTWGKTKETEGKHSGNLGGTLGKHVNPVEASH